MNSIGRQSPELTASPLLTGFGLPLRAAATPGDLTPSSLSLEFQGAEISSFPQFIGHTNRVSTSIAIVYFATEYSFLQARQGNDSELKSEIPGQVSPKIKF